MKRPCPTEGLGSGLIILLLALLLGGCAGAPSRVPGATEERFTRLDKAQAEIPEQQLLDLWIELFEPGEASGAAAEIRRAEARFIPIHLRNTLETTGYWGAVRVVPHGVEGAEILVRGAVLRSDADTLALRVTAEDARGRIWLSSVYEARSDLSDPAGSAGTAEELYQPLYNAIANDLARYRAQLAADEITKVRRLAELRFAADLVRKVEAEAQASAIRTLSTLTQGLGQPQVEFAFTPSPEFQATVDSSQLEKRLQLAVDATDPAAGRWD